MGDMADIGYEELHRNEMEERYRDDITIKTVPTKQLKIKGKIMKTSKIKEIPFVSPKKEGFPNRFYNLIMENGDKINILKKDGLETGKEITYEITGESDGQQEYVKAKSVQKEFNKGGYVAPDPDAILYAVCLKGVFDYFTAHGSTQFEAPQINELALSIAIQAKENIKVLKTK